ncbi:AAA domain (dynein-related subfamily) [Kandleria vitulina]|uniref:AAA domain (Dynein-related subfamily) n=1 Tax=Kandleria vitulina TaxID=1630 RepID=A0A1H2VLC5_9FIRM|nr:AAA family ATPase [Kandleria vitulina]SDW69155.1 AAA domain (dynein-related subfamily) [Kandleria vitulina]
MNNTLIIGPSGSGKTYLAKKIADDNETLFVHMNENVSYDNLVEGTQVSASNGALMYVPKKQKLLLFLDEAKNNSGNEYCVILDDINRSDMSTVLGELIYAFQDRGKVISLKSGKTACVPDNVKLIVTLNSSEVTSANEVVKEEIFNQIIHLDNGLPEYEQALDNIKKASLCSLGKTEYEDLVKWLKGVYDKYVNQYCVFTREYRNHANEYRVGMAYFLPSTNVPVNRWNECIKHRIRHQVHPLLFKYAEDGIIKKDEIPRESINDTEYVIRPVKQERIVIHSCKEVEDYENDVSKGKPLPIGAKSKLNSSHKFNWMYLVIMIVLRDIIDNSLISHDELIDLLENDAEILTFRNDITVSGRTGACLLVRDDLASSFPVRDSSQGNTKGGYSYSNNYHKFSYDGKIYRMFSAWQVTNTVKCPYSVSKCIETNTGSQKRHLYRTIKMLVYKYFKRYEMDLNNILAVEPTNVECIARLSQLNQDINFVEKLTDDKNYNGKPYYVDLSEGQNALVFISTIRKLPTWQKMMKECGVYKTMSKNYKEIMNVTNVKQMILQGPPGTSKTYGAKKFIAEQAKISGDDWELQLNDNQLKTEGDKYFEKTPGKNVYWDLLQFHPSYTYEDFVRGISVKPLERRTIEGTISSKDKDEELYRVSLLGDSGVEYKSVNRALGKIAALAKEAYDKDPTGCAEYYLVIDEINRANLATVFGELIYAFEYRGDGGTIRTPYEVDGDDALVLPPNLYIIGTMNTADKSIGTIDYAIRRRFLFFKLLPEISVVCDSISEKNPSEDLSKAIEVKQFESVEQLFNVCLNKADYEKEDVQLGHTYFLRKESNLAKSAEQAKYRYIYQVLPILFEYKKDGVLDFSRVASLSNDNTWKDVLMNMIKMIEANDATRNDLYDEFVGTLNMPEIENDINEIIQEKQAD